MRHRNRTPQRSKGSSFTVRGIRHIVENLGIVFLALALVFAIGIVESVRSHAKTTSSGAVGATGNGQATSTLTSSGSYTTCGGSGQSACQVQGPGWIPLVSEQPADVLTAMKSISLFHMNLNDNGDHIHDLSHLGTPLLVRALQPVGAKVSDYYVLPVLNTAGATSDVLEYELNTERSALRFVTVVSYMKPFANGIVQFSAAQASSAIQTQRRVIAKAGAQPYLVFFPTNASARQDGTVIWNGGGDAPDNPIWMIPGEDGVNYLLGNDGKVYAQKDLPISV